MILTFEFYAIECVSRPIKLIDFKKFMVKTWNYKQLCLRLKDLWRNGWKVLHIQRYVLHKINNSHFKWTLNAIRVVFVRIPSLTPTYCLRILETDLHSINPFISHAPLSWNFYNMENRRGRLQSKCVAKIRIHRITCCVKGVTHI